MAIIYVGGRLFDSKKAVKDYSRLIRDQHVDDQPIVSQEYVDHLLGLLALHPQSAEKIGQGVAAFYVAKAPSFGTRCFYLRRVDGSTTDFSWNEAVTETKPLVRLRMACRNAIEAQKSAFRDADWPLTDTAPRECPITKSMFQRSDAHVDHMPPATLSALVAEWCQENNWSIDRIPIDHLGDMKATDRLADAEQLASWRAFHQRHMKLRIVSAAGNMRQGSRLLVE